MKITTYGDNLIQLTRLTAFNCFLVRENDGFTLVDTGLSGSANDILNCRPRSRRADPPHPADPRPRPITSARSTRCTQLLPDVEVAISARDARFLTGDHSLDADEPQLPLKGGYPVIETTADSPAHARRADRLAGSPSPAPDTRPVTWHSSITATAP